MVSSLKVHNTETLSDKIKIDCPINSGVIIHVGSDTEDLLTAHAENGISQRTIFSIGIEAHQDTLLNFDVDIDDLELFASSILKQVDIIRRNFGEAICKQKSKGVSI